MVAPPATVRESFILFGENFAPDSRYTINLDSEPTMLSGQVNTRGEIALTVQLPSNISPGPHVVRVCVDCRSGGAQQEAVAAFIVADPQIAPSSTPQP